MPCFVALQRGVLSGVLLAVWFVVVVFVSLLHFEGLVVLWFVFLCLVQLQMCKKGLSCSQFWVLGGVYVEFRRES